MRDKLQMQKKSNKNNDGNRCKASLNSEKRKIYHPSASYFVGTRSQIRDGVGDQVAGAPPVADGLA